MVAMGSLQVFISPNSLEKIPKSKEYSFSKVFDRKMYVLNVAYARTKWRRLVVIKCDVFEITVKAVPRVSHSTLVHTS